MEARNEQMKAIVMRDEVFSYSQTLLNISKKVQFGLDPFKCYENFELSGKLHKEY